MKFCMICAQEDSFVILNCTCIIQIYNVCQVDIHCNGGSTMNLQCVKVIIHVPVHCTCTCKFTGTCALYVRNFHSCVLNSAI